MSTVPPVGPAPLKDGVFIGNQQSVVNATSWRNWFSQLITNINQLVQYINLATNVTQVSGTPPVVSSGGSAPIISMPAATDGQNGYLTSTDHQALSAAVPNTRTVNGKALSGNITLGLASADFANQGSTTTVLHGNAAGNPAFGAVVEADITLAVNTTNDVSVTKHGFAPQAPNDTTKFLRGDGTWNVPPSGSVVEASMTPFSGTYSSSQALVYVPFSLSHAFTRSGVSESSMWFNGSTSYVSSFANHTDFNVSTGDASWAFWVLYDPAGFPGGYGYIFDRGSAALSYSIYINSSNKFCIYNRVAATEYACSSVLTGTYAGPTWVHCAIVKSGTNYLFYINGAYVNTVAGANIASSNALPTTMGMSQDHANTPYQGLLSEFVFYNRAITATEVLHLKQLNYAANDYIARFKINETAGATLTDQTGNHNGTIVSMGRYDQGGPQVSQGYTSSPIPTISFMPGGETTFNYIFSPIMQVLNVGSTGMYVALSSTNTGTTEAGWVLSHIVG